MSFMHEWHWAAALAAFACGIAAISGARNVCGPVAGGGEAGFPQGRCRESAGVRYQLDGENLYASSYMDSCRDVVYQFRKCMYNELYTLCRVGAVSNAMARPVAPRTSPDMLFNATDSDNIGPWGIAGNGWAGGNHSWREGGAVHTARTVEWSVYADGVRLCDGDGGFAEELAVEVRNELYDPRIAPADGDAGILPVPMCMERMLYLIDGNSMRVRAEHDFVRDVPVSRYYGMQSMFIGETHVLAPGLQGSGWSPAAGKNLQLRKSEAPEFNLFTERKGGEYFQTAYLLPSGLGSHDFVREDSPVFIYASYGKNYHVLVDGHSFRNGDKTAWEGIYTWFVQPLVDDESLFCHEGRIDSERAVYIHCLSAVDRVIEIAGLSPDSTLKTIEVRGDISVSAADGGIAIRSSSPAMAIVAVE